MNSIKQIRQALGMKQTQMAAAIGCSQGAISFYELGRNDPPPDVATVVIGLARSLNLDIGYDHVYGAKPIPQVTELNASGQEQGQAAAGA